MRAVATSGYLSDSNLARFVVDSHIRAIHALKGARACSGRLIKICFWGSMIGRCDRNLLSLERLLDSTVTQKAYFPGCWR
jgi:hypothetical protein